MNLRKALSLIALVAAPALGHAQWWKNYHHGMRPEVPATAEKVTYTRQDLHQAKTAAANFVINDNFPLLERMYFEFLEMKDRATDGAYMLEGVLWWFSDMTDLWDEEAFSRKMATWEKQIPDSRLRPLLVPARYQRAAWKARGHGYAHQTTREGVQIFREKLRLAAAALKETEDLGKSSPMWWDLALRVAGDSGAGADVLDVLFEQAAARWPLYRPFYTTRLDYLLPKWGGSFEEVDRFIEAAVKRTARDEGEAMYAWLYVSVARGEPDRFEASAMEEARMKRAFEDMVARHPDPYNDNFFATFACRVRDRETTGRLLAKLGSDARLGGSYLGSWGRGISTEGCRRMAFTSS